MEPKTGTFAGRDGLTLFYRHWLPRSATSASSAAAGPKPAPLVIAHGLSEHSGRYGHVAEFFTRREHPVWALDHRGHGRSEGVRVFVRRFSDYLDDLHRFVEQVRAAEDDRSPVLIGHSMGGLIALAYALEHPQALAGLVLSSPWLGLKLRPALHLRLLVPLLSQLTPRLSVPNDALTAYVCRDPDLLEQYMADPLRCRTATPRWFVEATRMQQQVRGRAGELQVPVLFLVAGDDRLVDAEVTRSVFEAVSAPKTWRLYPQMYHEVFNDPDRQQVLADLHQWLAARGLTPAIAAAQPASSAEG